MARNPEINLTDKQRRFCEEYLKDFNGTAAILRTGYQCNRDAARVQASRLLTNANIQAYLQYLRKKIADASEVTLERTIQEIGRVAYSDINNALSFGPDGVKFKDSSELSPEVTAAISSVSSSEITKTFKGETTVTKTNTLRSHSKVKALTLLSNFYGLCSDFNQARATLKRYGLALVEDPESDLGWRLERYAADSDSVSEADRAAEEFFPEEEKDTD